MAPKAKAPAKRANPFLAGGQERGQGDRWTHDDSNIGTTLLGRFTGTRPIKFEDGKEASALVFSPAVVMDSAGEITVHRTIETIFSAALATKINPEVDKGIVFGIEYTGTEPSKTRGRAPFKTFTIAEMMPASLVKQLKECGAADLAALVPLHE